MLGHCVLKGLDSSSSNDFGEWFVSLKELFVVYNVHGSRVKIWQWNWIVFVRSAQMEMPLVG